jgi:hypothetical protein
LEDIRGVVSGDGLDSFFRQFQQGGPLKFAGRFLRGSSGRCDRSCGQSADNKKLKILQNPPARTGAVPYMEGRSSIDAPG